MRPHPMKRLWTSLFVLSGIFSLACQGDIIEPDVPSPAGPSTGTGGKKGGTSKAPGTAANGGGDPGTVPWTGVGGGNSGNPGNPVPAPVPDAFTRLTRTEYAATVNAAFGVRPDVTIIPGDGRIGPFTSNSGPTPDPVHPYILSAEDLAAEIVPAKLPACEGSRAPACVEASYRAPLERLYRRALTAAEVTRLAGIVSNLAGQGVAATEATRAMVSAALLSPDFLFHSAAAGLDAAAKARRLAERLSYALWDAPPDESLSRAAAEGAAKGGLSARLRTEALRVASDARAVPVLARFLAQWLHLDLDLRLENPAFASSPRYLELVAFVDDAVKTNASVTSLVAGQRGFVHRDNVAAYGLTASGTTGSAVSAVTWEATSPRRGLIGQDLILDSTRHPDKSRRWIFRGRLIRSSLLCDVIPVPAPDLVAAAGEVSDRTSDARCSSCHLRMDPIGKAFAALDTDDTGSAPPAEVRFHPELEGTYETLPELLDAVATSRAFAECFAKNWLGFFLEQPLASADPVVVAQIADAVQAGATLRDVVEGTMVNLEASSGAVEPMCKGL